ncbi:hypothetical protein [Salinibacter altiplanensis]|uniref:hypothetical protein n=1 Tax=Salinibacter altiplanensis TaxID=1803181 RepID=UPI000C9F133C|nr:hypothetical protein [Salinibacter altiplanensis]
MDPPSTDDGHRAPEYAPTQLREDIRALIESHVPALVLTHGSSGEYGHPAHQLLHQRTAAAVDAADLRLETIPHVRAKVRALTCHRTQWTAFVGQ